MSKDSENWALLQTLFYLAEETPSEEREKILSGHCKDPELIRQALELSLRSTALHDPGPIPALPFKSVRIGPYTLLRPLGSGGIGTVYLAERIAGGAPQRVALKMLSPHAAGGSFLERFHREQHILGLLDHPNITRMMDAGLTDAGEPYLVMEYVDGAPLTTYCDERRLPVADRLALFLTVCEAVACAHRSLIVHLDLKPSNIFVSHDGVVKLLDFGTSKLIETDGLMTTTIMATPAYSSPEQLRHEPVTTACDVYSLGTILFELLAGRRPFQKSSVAALIERAIAELPTENILDAVSAEGAANRQLTEARLRQTLTGDLKTITQKCLQVRPQDRYLSVDALLQDVTRFLRGQAILARRQTVLYLVSKFVRRHRPAVAATLAFTLLLGGTGAYAFWRQRQALEQARRAEQMQTFMHELFRVANAKYTGKPAVTVPEFLQLGVKLLPNYIRNPQDQLQAKVALAESMIDNGDLADAATLFQQCAETASAMHDPDVEVKSKAFLGHILILEDHVDAGMPIAKDALRLSHQSGVSPTSRIWAADLYAYDHERLNLISDENLELAQTSARDARRYDLPPHEQAQAIHLLANLLVARGRFEEATPLLNEALAKFSQEPVDVCDQANVYQGLGYMHFLNNEIQASVPLLQHGYEGYRSCVGPDGRDTIGALARYSDSLVASGRAPEALALLQAARPDWERMPGHYISMSEYPIALAHAYFATGQYPEAAEMASALLDARTRQALTTPDIEVELVLSQALAAQQRYQDALPHADNAVKLLLRRVNNRVSTVSPIVHVRLQQAQQIDADIRTHLALPALP